MNCLLDNIVFSLQKGGGISVVWQEHIQRLLEEKNISCSFIEYEDAHTNIFRKQLCIPTELIESLSPKGLAWKRYVNVKGKKCAEPYIFHSSYYRIDANPKARNITTVHDFTYEYFVRGLKQKIHSMQKNQAIRKADAVICISESTKKDLLRFVPEVDERKIVIIPNGVSNEFRLLNEEEYQVNLSFDNKGYALYVGSRHVPYKNFKAAVEVCAHLKLPLVMVGGEPMLDNEADFLNQKLGKGFYQNFWGASTAVLNELYNRALAFLYPSLYEGFGIPVIEAQRAGCPVVALAVSSIPEVMGNTDFMLRDTSVGAIEEAAKNLIDHSELREQEISKGLRNAQRFSWDITYKETMKVYRTIL